MTVQTSPNPNVAALQSEADGQRSREKINITAGQILAAGAVIAKVTATGNYVAYDNADSPAGSGTAAGVLLYRVDASAGITPAAAVLRDCEVTASLLRFKTGTSLANADLSKADLAANGIIVRGDWEQTFPIA